MGSGAGRSSSTDANGPRLRVRLLGGVDLRLGETPVPPLDSGRAESLLAYLLLHRDAPQQRQHLAFLLWPDSTEAQARTNLRHVLHNLRRALPEADRFIDVRSRTLQWRPGAPLWLDVAAFEQAVADGQLAEAVETYAGDLLEGAYDDWLLEERARLAQLHADALEQLVRELEGEGRWSEAIRYAERLLRRDPLREDIHRLLMHLHDSVGDRARPSRLPRARGQPQRELGVEPSAETRAAYEALLPVASDLTTTGGARVPPLGSPPLVGRAEERARLTALWRTAERGSAQLALVSGEPGIGKTRLVDELRAWCAHRGAVTAEARAYPAEGAMAYGLVTAWLRSEPVAARRHRVDPAQLSEVTRLLPELRREVPDLPVPEPLSDSEQRQRLFGAVAAAVLTAGAPLLLVADDLQWCDVETLQLVHYLLRAHPDAQLLVAATVRREDIDARHPFHELVTGLQALGCSSEIPLERLSREETRILAQRLVSRTLTETEADRLYADSEGNPLFVVEALRADTEATPAPGTADTSRVQAVIAARLARLSQPAAELVVVAATIGREFTAQVLADASGVDEQTFVKGLDELWRRGLVRAHGLSAYDFSHARIREAAYRTLSPAQARHYHVRVARALERSQDGDHEPISAQVATHYDAAGAAPQAAEWFLTAAEAAQRLHASADAVRFLERALQLVRGLPAGNRRARLELRILTALPAPLIAVDGYLSPRVMDVHERTRGLAAVLAVEPEAPLVRSLALARLSRGDFEGARPFGEQLRARAEQEHDDVLWVESAYVLGVTAFWQGRLEAARTQFEAAVRRYRPKHRAVHLLRYGQDPRVFCELRLGYTLWLLGRSEEARRRSETALALAEASDHPFTRTSTMAWAGLLALDQHDEQRLRRQVQALASGATAQSAKPVRLFTEALTGYLDVLDGRSREGLGRVRRALDEARAGEPAAPGLLAMHMRILLEACAQSQDASTGVAAADEALGMGGGTQLWEAEIRRLRAQFLTALSAPPEAVEAELWRALEVAQRQGSRPLERRARDDLARLRAGTA